MILDGPQLLSTCFNFWIPQTCRRVQNEWNAQRSLGFFPIPLSLTQKLSNTIMHSPIKETQFVSLLLRLFFGIGQAYFI